MPLPNDHLHTYERSARSKRIYRCIHPECTHYHDIEFIVGKKSLCNKCGEPFILERHQLYGKTAVKNPTCLNCANSKKAQAHRKLRDLVAETLVELGEEV